MADGPSWTAGHDSPPPAGPPRAHLILVAFLALCGLGLIAATAVLVFGRDDGADVAVAPTATPTTAVAPPSETTPPRPARSERNRPPRPIGRPIDLGDLAQQVSEIRQIELSGPLNSRLVNERSLADKVSDIAFAEQDPAEIADTERLLIALRMAEPDVDLGQIVEALYREQILGLYVPEESTLYVRRRGADSPAQQMTTAHEITHALQDQAFGLLKMQEAAEEDDDAALAVLSLIEGDAVLTQQLWAQEHLTAEELAQAAGESASSDTLDQAPDYLRESLFFPYAQGGLFVAELYRAGGFEAVDAAFEKPPTSSEHILHPERYRDGDEPVDVTVKARPGPGWTAASTYQFGEFDLDQLLQPLGDDTATTAAEGWGGGAIRSWSRAGQTAVASRLVFDTREDADQACDALPRWYATVADGQTSASGSASGDRDHFAFRCFGETVDFALAPTPQTARKLTAAP